VIWPASASGPPPCRRGASIRKGVEFRSFTSEQGFKAGGVGFSRKSEDQAKSYSINRQIVNNVPFSCVLCIRNQGRKYSNLSIGYSSLSGEFEQQGCRSTSRRTHPEEIHACQPDVAEIPLAALSNEGKAGKPAIVNSFIPSAALAA
jgi:hypothetical protein